MCCPPCVAEGAALRACAPSHAVASGDPADCGVIRRALSRLVGEARGERRFTRWLCVAISGAARVELPVGEQRLAPLLSTPAFGWPDARSVLPRLGLTADELTLLWRELQARHGGHAVLPDEVLRALFPDPCGDAARRLVHVGPVEMLARLVAFCRLEVVRPAPVTRARPAGGAISEGTIDALLAAGWRFARAVSTVALEVGDELSPWHRLPPPVAAAALGALPANTDRSAPPVAAVRDAFERLSDAIDRAAPGSQLRGRLVRNRLLLALLACTGARVSAISRLRVCDYEPTHMSPSGRVGPALRVRPGKTLPDHVARWKPVPAEVSEWIELHINGSGLSSESPLFPTARDGRRAMGPDSLTKLLLYGERMTLGRSAHTLRHLAERLAYQVGREHSAADAAELVPPQAFADALLDHAFAIDPLGYKDLEQQREELAGIAAASIWHRLRHSTVSPADTIAVLRAQRKRLFDRDVHSTDRDAITVLLEHARLTTLIDDLSA